MQNQQAQTNEFLNFLSTIENTPPDKTQEFMTTLHHYYDNIVEKQQLGFWFFKLAEHITRLKAVNEHTQWLSEQCIFDIITRAVNSEFKAGS